ALRRNCDGAFRDQRDLFVRTIQNGPRRISGRSFVSRELFLPIGQGKDRQLLCRRAAERGQTRLPTDSGIVGRKAFVAARRNRQVEPSSPYLWHSPCLKQCR